MKLTPIDRWKEIWPARQSCFRSKDWDSFLYEDERNTEDVFAKRQVSQFAVMLSLMMRTLETLILVVHCILTLFGHLMVCHCLLHVLVLLFVTDYGHTSKVESLGFVFHDDDDGSSSSSHWVVFCSSCHFSSLAISVWFIHLLKKQDWIWEKTRRSCVHLMLLHGHQMTLSL